MINRHCGGCVCGHIRYEATADPFMIYACHCTVCQRQSGTAFGLIAAFDVAHVTWSGDHAFSYVRNAPSCDIRSYFCARCGTPLYYRCFNNDGDFPFIGVKVGTLDDPAWARPGCHVWAQHAQPWIRFSADDVVFQQQPSWDEMPRFVRA